MCTSSTALAKWVDLLCSDWPLKVRNTLPCPALFARLLHLTYKPTQPNRFSSTSLQALLLPSGNLNGQLMDDGVHPDADGYNAMFSQCW